MYEGRNLGGLPTGDLDAKALQHYAFASFMFPQQGMLYDPILLRYTNKPGGFLGDIGSGEGSVMWAQHDFKFADISNSQQTIMEVTSIEIANLDNVWSSLVLGRGIEMKLVKLYQVFFNISTGAVTGTPRVFEGRMELARIKDGICYISLIPHRSGLSQLLPARIIGPACGVVYGDPRTCQFTNFGSFPTCDHTRAACAERSNLLHFGGEDLIPKDKLIWRTVE